MASLLNPNYFQAVINLLSGRSVSVDSFRLGIDHLTVSLDYARHSLGDVLASGLGASTHYAHHRILRHC